MQATLTHRYQLDGSNRERKQKIDCPYCGAKRSFTRYKDYETGQYIADQVGMCDRSNKCGEHIKPKEWFAQHADKRPEFIKEKRDSHFVNKPLVHIPANILKFTLKNYENNSFIKSLIDLFPLEKIEIAISDYYIGTAKAGFRVESENNLPVVFWYIDQNKNIRAGQVKLFDKTCHTQKYTNSEAEIRPYQTWVHTLIEKKCTDLPQWLIDYKESEKITCLFGEHLLSKYQSKPVGLVEAPKTAIIASIVYPQFVWLATSSLTYLTKERCKVLKDREVILFPDCGIPNKKTGKTCLMEWKERISEFDQLAVFKFSTLLEERATSEQKEEGFDLADLILRETRKKKLQISIDQIEDVSPKVRGGDHMGGLVLYDVETKEGEHFDLAVDESGNLITDPSAVKSIETFFNKKFLPGTIDGKECLLNISNN